MDQADTAAVGMMVVVDLPERKSAQEFIDNEPYSLAGLFETVEIEPMRVMTEAILREELVQEQVR